MIIYRVACIILLLTFPTILTAAELNAKEIAEKTLNSVVLVGVDNERGETVTGSGFFVKDDIVVTNYHVIEGATYAYIRVSNTDNQFHVIGTVGVDIEHDLALLVIKGISRPIIPLSMSIDVKVGTSVYVVGNPLGLEGTFSEGIVSSIREIESGELLQITAPISPGSSGGPVLDSAGEVIGVASAQITSGQNLNFAVPVSYLRALLDSAHPVKSLTNIPKDPSKADVNPESWDLYKNKQYRFSLKVPSNWEIQENTMGLVIVVKSPKESSAPDNIRENVNVVVEKYRDDPNHYFLGNLAMMNKMMTNFEVHDQGTKHIADQLVNWVVYSSSMGSKHGKMIAYIFARNGKGYTITCTSSPLEFDRYEGLLRDIAESFTFK